MQTRDAHLDFLRGCAIVLVVIGHYLQASPDFDANFIFRLIYAFHMPLFMVICGMTAARNLGAQFVPARALSFSAFSAASLLPGKAMRLLLPFFAWAIVAYLLRNHRPPSASYLFQIVAQPDIALWFLPVLFCLYVAVAITQLIYHAGLVMTSRRFALPILVMSFLITWLSLIAMRNSFMLTLASLYFPFFCAGLLSAGTSDRKLTPFEWRALALVASFGFAMLLPLWHRTNVDPELISRFGVQHSAIIRAVMAVMTAACGVMVFLAIAREAKTFEGSRFHTLICFLGTRTLPIYAIHLFFLSLITNLFAIPVAIAASLGAAWLLQRNSLTRLLLLGEPSPGAPSPFRLLRSAWGLR